MATHQRFGLWTQDLHRRAERQKKFHHKHHKKKVGQHMTYVLPWRASSNCANLSILQTERG